MAQEEDFVDFSSSTAFSSFPLTALRKLRMPSPKPFPKSPRRLPPNISAAITPMMTSSIGPTGPIINMPIACSISILRLRFYFRPLRAQIQQYWVVGQFPIRALGLRIPPRLNVICRSTSDRELALYGQVEVADLVKRLLDRTHTNRQNEERSFALFLKGLNTLALSPQQPGDHRGPGGSDIRAR